MYIYFGYSQEWQHLNAHASTKNLPLTRHSLKGKGRVIAPTSSQTLIGQLKARGFEVAAVDMSEISKTGGGIHCMAQALKREPARGVG